MEFFFNLFHGKTTPHTEYIQWVPEWWYFSNGLPINSGRFSDGIHWLFIGWFLGKEEPPIIIKKFLTLKDVEILFKVDGQFILILYNQMDKAIEIFRDRCSIIPLLYGQEKDMIALSTLFSNIDKLLNAPTQPSTSLIKFWPLYRKTFPPYTPYNEIKGISAEYSLRIANGRITEISHPMHSPKGKKFKNLSQASIQLHEILLKAVEKRVEKAKRIGVLLSGGNDSSLVVALIRKFFSGTIHSVFVTFDGNQRDYGKYAEQVAKQFQTTHQTLQLSPKNYVAQWPKTIQTLQTPVPMPCHVGIDCALKQLSGKVDIMIDGDGADTVFGSSLWPQMIALSRWSGIVPGKFKKMLIALLNHLPKNKRIIKISGMINTALSSSLAMYPHVAAAMISEQEYNSVFQPEGWLWAVTERKGFATGEFYNGFFSYLMLHGIPEDIATSARLSYYHNILFSYPFLDYELLQASLLLPNNLRYHYRIRKAPLKKICLTYFDKKFVNKPKEGFGVPLGDWFTYKEFHSILMMPLEERSLKRGWWNENAVREVITAHKRGEGNDSTAEVVPWIIANIELWYRICVEKESPSLYIR